MVCDDQLVHRFTSGDEDAFRDIVDKYKAYVFAIILNFIKQQDEAENISQEVFLQIYRSLPQYKNNNLKSWIGKIATNKAIDWQRAKSRRIQEELGSEHSNIAQFTKSNSYNPEDLLLKKEFREQVIQICNQLPKIYKNSIIKFYIEEKSYREIALEEGVTIKTVESRLYRARNLFRERWEGEKNEAL